MTEDKSLHERVINLEAQLKEGLDNIKAQIDRLEQISKNSAVQLTHDVNKTLFANFAQLLEHGSKMFVSHIPAVNIIKRLDFQLLFLAHIGSTMRVGNAMSLTKRLKHRKFPRTKKRERIVAKSAEEEKK